MPHIPQDFRPVPGHKAPLATPIDELPVIPAAPREDKPSVALSGRPRVRKRHGLERISMRDFEKSPGEIAAALEGRDD